MTLIDELAKARTQGSNGRHKLSRVLSKLEAPEASALQTALEDPLLSSEAIVRALGTSGHPIGASSVRRYRREVLGLSFE